MSGVTEGCWPTSAWATVCLGDLVAAAGVLAFGSHGLHGAAPLRRWGRWQQSHRSRRRRRNRLAPAPRDVGPGPCWCSTPRARCSMRSSASTSASTWPRGPAGVADRSALDVPPAQRSTSSPCPPGDRGALALFFLWSDSTPALADPVDRKRGNCLDPAGSRRCRPRAPPAGGRRGLRGARTGGCALRTSLMGHEVGGTCTTCSGAAWTGRVRAAACLFCWNRRRERRRP